MVSGHLKVILVVSASQIVVVLLFAFVGIIYGLVAISVMMQKSMQRHVS